VIVIYEIFKCKLLTEAKRTGYPDLGKMPSLTAFAKRRSPFPITVRGYMDDIQKFISGFRRFQHKYFGEKKQL